MQKKTDSLFGGKHVLPVIILAACLAAVAAVAVWHTHLNVAQAGDDVAHTGPRHGHEVDLNTLQSLAQDNNEFACDMYRAIRRQDHRDISFSPFSISTAMAMVHGGAQGETKQQIADVLHFNIADAGLYQAFAGQGKRLNQRNFDGEPVMSLANSIWVDESLKLQPHYIKLITDVFNGGIETIDFARPAHVAEKINEWTAEKTFDQIKEIVHENDFDAASVLALVNCLALSLPWEPNDYFSPDRTRDASFFIDRERQVTVPMMQRQGGYRAAVGNGFTALEMPLGMGPISLLIVLPDEIDGLDAVEDKLSVDLINDIRENLAMTGVDLYLPRFTNEQDLGLNDLLITMGVEDAFASGKADFSGIAKDSRGGLYISNVKHKALTTVFEDGVKAAAATAVIMTLGMSPPPAGNIEFKVDHPFMYLIQDSETGAVLFMGRVMELVPAPADTSL